MSRNNNRVGRSLCKAVLALAISAILPATSAVAQTSESVSAFDIPAGKLSDALDSFMSQSGAQILYKSDLIAGKKSQALRGSMDRAVALTQLLAGTGLVWEKANGSTFVIKRTETAPTKSHKTQDKVGTAPVGDAESEPTTMNTLVVTGTRIRGGTTASPVITIGADQIREEGFTDLGEVVRSISQNFSGGQNPGVAAGASLGNVANQNITGSSALNLRGLGPDATLTLLNGRRLTYDGSAQAVDISAIPIEAVGRVEIVPDGASAIYGSDAVAGVANVILKRDFDGVTLGARYGRAANGGLGTHEYTATAGTTWSSGGLIATYKDSSQVPIFADQRDYTRAMDDPTTIYNGSDLRSGLVSAYQLLGEVVKLEVDAFRTDRENSQFTAYPGLNYAQDVRTSVSQVSPNVEFSLPANWTLTVGGTYGKNESAYEGYFVVDGTSELGAAGCYCNKSRAYEVGAEGPLFALGGGDARLAVGAGSRTNEFLYRAYIPSSRQDGKEQSRFGYAELSLPFIDATSEVKGIHRLELSAAIRSENYDNFGRVTTPKLGLIYGPSTDFTIKASWGKSFKAPTLVQRYQDKTAYLWIANQVGGTTYPADAMVLMSYGGNPNLNPERARTWSTSLAYHPDAVPGLEAELTWFDIDYIDRVVQPISNIGQALSNQNFAQFIQYSPTLEQQAALLADYNGTFYNYTGFDYDPSMVTALAFNQYTNAARQRIKGADLSGSYGFDLQGSRLILRGGASWLNSSQQNSVEQPMFDLSGTIFNPAKFKSRFGAVWTRGGLVASGFANYTSGVTSKLTASTEKTGSFTTIDATVTYSTGERGDGWSGLEFVLSAENLMNRNPPLYTTPSLSFVPYDSTNYSAIGRYLSLSISKHW